MIKFKKYLIIILILKVQFSLHLNLLLLILNFIKYYYNLKMNNNKALMIMRPDNKNQI